MIFLDLDRSAGLVYLLKEAGYRLVLLMAVVVH